MEVAKTLLKKQILYLEKEVPLQKKLISSIYKNLAQILVRLGDLECQKEQFS